MSRDSSWKIAFVCPDDPRTGISMYTKILMQGMRELGVCVELISSPGPGCLDFDLLHFQIGGSRHHAFVWHLLKQLSKRAERPLLFVTIHEPTLWDIAVDFRQDYYSRAKKRFYFEMIYHFGINLPLRSALRRADGCIVLSKYLLNFIRAKNVAAVAHPIPFGIGRGKRSPATPFKIFAPGFICPHKGKGIEALLTALSTTDFPTELTVNTPGTKECDSPALQSVLSLAENFAGRVRLVQTGFVGDELFLNYFKTADLVFIPRASTNGEISGPAYYALGAGVPLLIPRLDAFCEIQHHGYPLFYRPGDIDSIRDALHYVLENYESINSLAVQEREYWLKVCSPRAIAARHLKIYRPLLKRKRGAAVPSRR
jgi:glycosyltransferase involved in cell wall biosynthesis